MRVSGAKVDACASALRLVFEHLTDQAHFKGSLDEVQVYPRALDAQEALAFDRGVNLGT